MNSRFYIPALITLGLGILSGCGGTSPAASTASIHVVNYKPSSDSAEQIGFYWSSNDGEATNNMDALVVLYNPHNISKGLGSATCSVRDAEYTETEIQQDNCQAVIREFRVPPSSDQ